VAGTLVERLDHPLRAEWPRHRLLQLIDIQLQLIAA
jgi:hypothetical protein